MSEDALVQKQSQTPTALLYGNLICNDATYKDFVYVPRDWEPPKDKGSRVQQAMKALGVDIPDIVFFFDKGHNVDEHRSDGTILAGTEATVTHGNARVVEERVRAVVDGISEACGQTASLYVLQQAFYYNRLAKIAIESAASHDFCPSLSMLTPDELHYLDPSRDEDTRTLVHFQEQKAKMEGQRETLLSAGDQLIPWADSGDRQKVKATEETIRKVVKPDPKEISQAVPVTTVPTAAERAFYEVFGDSGCEPGPLEQVHHILVFATRAERERFATEVLKELPTGIILAGGVGSSYDRAIACLKNGHPIFVFRGTGGAADVIADLIEFGTRRTRAFIAEGSSTTVAPMFTSDEEAREFIEARFPPLGSICCLPGFEATANDIVPKARVFAQSFPERFNPDATLVINVGAAEGELSLPLSGTFGVDALQAKITRVMGAVYNTVMYNTSSGGQEADLRVVRHASALQRLLLASSDRHFRESTSLMILYRLLYVATTALAVAEPLFLRDAAEGDTALYVVRALGVVLPLLLGMAATIFSTYRPRQKFATLFLAAKRIEAELLRFLTRTKPYHASMGLREVTRGRAPMGKGHRQVFTRTCDAIVSELGTSDVRAGAMQLVNTRTWLSRVAEQPVPAARSQVDPGQPSSRARSRTLGNVLKNARVAPQPALDREATDDEVGWSGRGRGLAKLLSADEYVEHRLLVELHKAQLKAPQLQRRLKLTQFLVVLGAVACVLVNSIHASFVPESHISLLNPVVLALTGTVEAYMAYTQLETDLPAINGVVLALTKVLLWWDGLSLIQQRMPATRDRLVETCETAMLLRHNGYAAGALVSLGNDLGADDTDQEESKGRDAGGRKGKQQSK